MAGTVVEIGGGYPPPPLVTLSEGERPCPCFPDPSPEVASAPNPTQTSLTPAGCRQRLAWTRSSSTWRCLRPPGTPRRPGMLAGAQVVHYLSLSDINLRREQVRPSLRGPIPPHPTQTPQAKRGHRVCSVGRRGRGFVVGSSQAGKNNRIHLLKPRAQLRAILASSSHGRTATVPGCQTHTPSRYVVW